MQFPNLHSHPHSQPSRSALPHSAAPCPQIITVLRSRRQRSSVVFPRLRGRRRLGDICLGLDMPSAQGRHPVFVRLGCTSLPSFQRPPLISHCRISLPKHAPIPVPSRYPQTRMSFSPPPPAKSSSSSYRLSLRHPPLLACKSLPSHTPPFLSPSWTADPLTPSNTSVNGAHPPAL